MSPRYLSGLFSGGGRSPSATRPQQRGCLRSSNPTAGYGRWTRRPLRASRHGRRGGSTARAYDREMSQKPGATFATVATRAQMLPLCSLILQPSERHSGGISVQNAPWSPHAGALWRKMRDNQETPGDNCDSCDKRLKFTVRSKTVAEVANVAPPTGDMPHRLASLTLFVKMSCKSKQKDFNARSDAEQASRSCFFVLKMSPESQLSQGRSAQVKKTHPEYAAAISGDRRE